MRKDLIVNRLLFINSIYVVLMCNFLTKNIISFLLMSIHFIKLIEKSARNKYPCGFCHKVIVCRGV